MRVFDRLEFYINHRLSTEESRQTYRSALRSWARYLRVELGTDKAARRFYRSTVEDVEGYIMHLKACRGRQPKHGGDDRVSDATIRGRIQQLGSMFEYLLRKGILQRNPFKDPDIRLRPRAYQKLPTELIPFEKVLELIEAPDRYSRRGLRDRAMFALAFGGALRRREITRLRLRDIRRSPKGQTYLWLVATKAGVDVSQALPAWALPHLEAWKAFREREGAGPDEYLFANAEGTAYSNHALYHRWKVWCEAIGLDPRLYSPHSARATAITKLLSDGVSHWTVAKFSRHSSVQMVERYDKRFLSVDDCPGKNLSFKIPKKTLAA